jgi:hypothetical protein
MISARQSKLLATIDAYKPVIRSDPSTNSKIRFGCMVSHNRQGRRAYLVVLVAGEGAKQNLGTSRRRQRRSDVVRCLSSAPPN